MVAYLNIAESVPVGFEIVDDAVQRARQHSTTDDEDCHEYVWSRCRKVHHLIGWQTLARHDGKEVPAPMATWNYRIIQNKYIKNRKRIIEKRCDFLSFYSTEPLERL